ncbi:hypothetical protein DXG03_007323 [Asterophora parasitica]|uniref:Uncharacterized protein n=1 Tax=Asterophora parasitica TaxID=117018 RepID=A0A9P7KBV5_9AGAR|nr:hypothetical protein DXG03_007323 [Asterophora parasitica]
MTDKNNPLTIRLTESAVFLRSSGWRNRDQESRPSMLRGLLVMELSKPTRITSIKLDLVARSCTSWPEGIGTHRTDITEEHKLFHAETVCFRAGKVERPRRESSIGPGAAAYDAGEAGYESEDQHTPSYAITQPMNHEQVELGESQANPGTAIPRRSRSLSADNSYSQRVPSFHEDFSVLPTPPYSPFSQPSSPISDQPTLSSAQTPDDPRNSLNAGIRGSITRMGTQAPHLVFSLIARSGLFPNGRLGASKTFQKTNQGRQRPGTILNPHLNQVHLNPVHFLGQALHCGPPVNPAHQVLVLVSFVAGLAPVPDSVFHLSLASSSMPSSRSLQLRHAFLNPASIL